MVDFSEHTQIGIRCAADILRGCRNVTVLSGAGVSTPSGIPDFRSADSGLWSRSNPMEVASLTNFRYRPEVFFSWMRPLAKHIRTARPNAAHEAIARLEQAHIVQTVVTQNIDNLHQRAGSTRVLEVHGTLASLTCVSCYLKARADEHLQPYLDNGLIPRCPKCGGVLKPDVILFGEQLPARAWLQAERAARECDAMIVVGSSLEVLPVAGLPMKALEAGAHLIVVNQSQTYIDVRADVVFREDVMEILPYIASEVLSG
jgi:NAD-dependent deacetylase